MKNATKSHRVCRFRIRGIAPAFFVTALVLGSAAAAVSTPAPTPPAQSATKAPSESLDAILKDLKTFDYAQGVGAPLRLRAYVWSHKDDPADRKDCEEKLIAFLKSGPSQGGMMAACRELRLIGTPASVPVLQSMLARPETTDEVRFALDGIPGEEVDRVLLATLDATQGPVRRGIISVLGDRATAAAAPRLAQLAGGNDADTAVDAVKALGKIGTEESVRSLSTILGKASANLKSGAASALLLCAEAHLKAGKTGDASSLYDKVFAAAVPEILRQAAFRGKILSAGRTDAQGLILKALAGKDEALKQPAIDLIPKAYEGAEVSAVLPYFGKLDETRQMLFVTILAGFPKNIVLQTLRDAASSPSPAVRIAALRAIEKAGDASVVELLATRAAKASGGEQAAAREALNRMRGASIDAAIMSLLEKGTEDPVKAELITAIGERRITAGKSVLMDIVRSGAPELRLRAIRALRVVAIPGDQRDLVGLLFGLEDETAREEMEDTVATVARTIPRVTARADSVENLYGGEKNPQRRADLLRVMGKIGDDTALPAVRQALSDPDKMVVDAAVRALADWPTVTARDDVLAIARSTDNLTYKVLTLRAYVRMVGLEPYLQPEAAVANLEKALALAGRPEEKRLVLGTLPKFPCAAGLKIAQGLLSDPAVKDEAKAAADRIQRSLARR